MSLSDAPVQLPPFFRGAVSDVRAQSLPYHLADQRLPDHWEHTGAGDGIIVGVADTGIDDTHPEVAGKVVAAESFVGGTFQDRNDHGTHVATTIAGSNVGVAPKAKLAIAKVLGDNGSGSNRGVAAGIRWLHEIGGANIINLSLGGPYDDPHTREAIDYVKSKGVIVIAATGNERASHVGYPAVYCVGVGAVDRALKLAYFSNRGVHVDLVGYGVNVYAGIPGGRYAEFSGTSMATPFIAGIAANRLSAERKHLGEIRTTTDADLLKLETFVTDLGPEGQDTSYGRGFPDLDLALYEQLAPPTPDPPPAPPITDPPSDPPPWSQFEPFEVRLRGMNSGKEYTPVAAVPKT